MMKSLRLFLFCLFFWPFISEAQQQLTLYGMKNLSQAFYLNPGFYQKNRVYVSLPLGFHSFALNHNGFTLNNLLEKTTNDSLLIRPDLAIEKMGKRNMLAFEQSSELLGFGFKIKRRNFFSFSTSLKSNLIFSYPRDLFKLINEGNGSPSFLGNRASLDGLGFHANCYAEYALGYNRLLTKKLTIGGRLKLLSGVANVTTKESKLGMITDYKSFDMTIDGQMAVNSSNALFFVDSSGGNILGNTFSTAAYDFKNFGLAIDAGGSYRLNDKLEFSASVLDLGYIGWKSNTKNYESSRVNYTFKGVDLDSVLFDDFKVDKYLSDTIEQIFGYNANSQTYSTSLYTRFYLGGVYHLNKTFSTSFTWHNQLMAQRLRTGAAIAFNMHVRNWLNFSLNYSAFGRSFRNVGVGLSLKGGPLQFFVLTDNALAFFNYANAKNAHLSFGLNVSIGPIKDKDGDEIKNKKDSCPEIPGKPEFKGCPDSDGDGITDAQDACPQSAGLKELSGCPDRDRDGVSDLTDACPEDSGLVAFQGCPDRDNDSIIDKNDTCPDLKGLSVFNGCPDSDGDGIIDAEDKCPTEGGTFKNEGCPDQDSDGIFDALDECPDKFGPKENKGCPWPDTDGDGLVDRDDDCPSTSGPAANRGCPVIEEAIQEVIQTAFDDLEFEIGKDVIKKISFPSLDALAEVLIKKSEWVLQISGHTDNAGDDQKNFLLSRKRAESVRNYLVSKGLSVDRFSVLYFGETMPIASNDTPDGRQKNRRVEMKIIFK